MKPAPPSGWFLDQPGGKYRTLNRLKTSTGPRSLERGESGDLRALQHPHLASTRPRSPERGEVFFWGGLLGCRVASTGPRSPERGEFYTGFEVNEHFVGLQRGHAHLSVERTARLLCLLFPTELQRGHAHLSVERSPYGGQRTACRSFNGATLT